jgi:pSer/pThr/pTyr-binding forkhead associated (FHA) protein
MYVLEVQNGPMDGTRWVFDRSILIGRDTAADAVLSLDPTVSRRHARIDVTDGGLILTDAGSSNGTLVDGNRVCGTQPLALDQTFVVGRTLLRVIALPDGAATDAATPSPAAKSCPVERKE